MENILNESCGLYGFLPDCAELIRHNENMTYAISDGSEKYVMRIHKSSAGLNLSLIRMGANPEMMIRDEIRLLEYLNGFPLIGTQRVKRNIHGESVSLLDDGTPVTVLEWIEGETVGKSGHTAETAFMMGQMAGRFHCAVEGISAEDYPHRYRYDGVMGDALLKECASAYGSGHMNKRQAEIITATLSVIRDFLYERSESLSLCHADMNNSNLIITERGIVPIDFSLSGFCAEEMDIAAAICEISDEAIIKEVMRGYGSGRGREADVRAVDICLCLQILLFICCQHGRCYTEPWFDKKLDDWCGNQFTSLLEGRGVSQKGGIYG